MVIITESSIVREVYNATMEASDTDGRRLPFDNTGSTPSSILSPGMVNPLTDS